MGCLLVVLGGLLVGTAAGTPVADATTGTDTGATTADGNATGNATATDGTQRTTKDTAVLWRGFRHAWSYNHRFNRFGSWVENQSCGPTNCRYEVGHSAASGAGKDVAAVRDAYTELSARNVAFVTGEKRIKLDGEEYQTGPEDEAFQKTLRVQLDEEEYPELRNYENYTVLINGFDVKSRGVAAKVMDFGLSVRRFQRVGDGYQFELYYLVRLDCDSFECKAPFNVSRGGKGVQDINYTVDVNYVVVAGNESSLNTVEGPEQDSDLDWDNCYNNGADVFPDPDRRNSDKYTLDATNGFPGNHMWCEASGGYTVQHENHYDTARITGDAGSGPHGYSVGTVGIQSIGLYIDEKDEAHFTQYDTVVGGSYNATDGSYALRALPFFKEWSTRPGMYESSKLSYGFDAGAEVTVDPVLVQLADGCKRSFVSAGKKVWPGQGKVPTGSAAVVDETYTFEFGDTWYGYQHGRGNYCDHPANPRDAGTQQDHEVPGRTIHSKQAFPLRDGYPSSVADPGDRIDLWNEFAYPEKGTVTRAEKTAQDPTMLRGRQSDRIYNRSQDTRPHPNVSKLALTAQVLHGSPGLRLVGSQSIDLINFPSDPGGHGVAAVATVASSVYQRPTDQRKRSLRLLVNDSVPSYEVETYFHEMDRANDTFVDTTPLGYSSNVTSASADEVGDYALELLVYCPDGSCQPVHAMVPFQEPSELNLSSVNEVHNATEVTNASAREDRDVYEFDLEFFERVSNASIRNGPGLTLTLENESGAHLETVPAGRVLETGTTTVDGEYRLEVAGDGVTDSYTLNLTTERISQKYEENDVRLNAYDLGADLNVNVPQRTLPGLHGNRRWCDGGGGDDDDTNVAGDTDFGDTSVDTSVDSRSLAPNGACPRHDWYKHKEFPAGYSLDDPDWYSVPMEKGERLNVNLSDGALGVELRHDGSVVKETLPSDDEPTLEAIAGHNGTYYLNVTGSDWVPRHDLQVQWIRSPGQDRFELNDEEAIATRLAQGVGENVTELDILKLGGKDEDYFAVHLADGDDINATIDYRNSAGDVNLTLVDPSGDVTLATNRSSQVQYRRQRATLTADEDGTHYVHVSGSTATALVYNLTVGTDRAKQYVGPVLGGQQNRYDLDDLEVDTFEYRDVPTPEEIAKANAIDDLGFRPDEPIGGMEIAVSQGAEPPADVPSVEERFGVVGASYTLVTHERPFEGTVRVRGRVSRERMDERNASPDDVAIYRHPGPETDGEWERVETEVVGETETALRVQGEVEGLSVFAIGIRDPEMGVDEPTPTERPADGDETPADEPATDDRPATDEQDTDGGERTATVTAAGETTVGIGPGFDAGVALVALSTLAGLAGWRARRA